MIIISLQIIEYIFIIIYFLFNRSLLRVNVYLVIFMNAFFFNKKKKY